MIILGDSRQRSYERKKYPRTKESGSQSTLPSYSEALPKDVPEKTTSQESTENLNYTELKEKSTEICNHVKEKFKENEKRIDWSINDHGIGHIKRTLENLENIINFLDEKSISKDLLGEKLTDYDKEILKNAARVHDLGRIGDEGGNHAIQSVKEIEKMKDIFPNKESRELISLLAQLHNKSGIKSLGGKSLRDLVSKGKIDKKIAYLESILTMADAGDLGLKRIEKNSRGMPKNQVIEKIKKELPISKQKSRLSHYYGHEPINDLDWDFKKGKIFVRINVNSGKLNSNGSDVAYRINDYLRDYNSTLFPDSKKGKLGVKFISKDPKNAKNWYNKHKLILSDEINSDPIFESI